MLAQISSSTRTVGFWAAVCATVFSLAYDVGQIAEWLGWLGSAGGPESVSTPLGIVVLLTPSLLLAPAFLLTLVALHQATPADRRVWTHAAVAFGTIYAALISINYYVQLAWVGPRLVRGAVEGMEPFLFVPFDSFLYAVDILGYGFMSVAALCAARALGHSRPEQRARFFLLATGFVLPFLLFQMYVHWLIWFAAAWAIAFPASMWALALLFRRTATSPA